MTRGGFRLLRRTQTVRRTVEEVYLRDDIACGSALCSKCAHLESDPALPPPLCADATHFAVPDARALAENVDAFLAAAVPGAGDVVLLASELRAAHARGDARLSRALRAFTADPRHARGVKLVPNEHFRPTSVVVGLGPARGRLPARASLRDVFVPARVGVRGVSSSPSLTRTCSTFVFHRQSTPLDSTASSSASLTFPHPPSG